MYQNRESREEQTVLRNQPPRDHRRAIGDDVDATKLIVQASVSPSVDPVRTCCHALASILLVLVTWRIVECTDCLARFDGSCFEFLLFQALRQSSWLSRKSSGTRAG